MSSEKQVKKYFAFQEEYGRPVEITWKEDTVTMHYHEKAYITLMDVGDGYRVVEVAPAFKKPRIYMIDYGLMADLEAMMKVFHRNSSKKEYWTVFEGEKI